MQSGNHMEIVADIESAARMEIKANERLSKRMTKMRDEYAKKHDEIVAKRSDRILSAVAEYKTEEEAQEAYGWGEITEKEKDEICSIIRGAQTQSASDTEYSIMVTWINTWLHAIKSETESLRYGIMTPQQKVEHDKDVDAWKSKIDGIRRKNAKNRS